MTQSKVAAFVAVLLALQLASGRTRADDKPEKIEKVEVRLIAILASQKHKEVQGKLSAFAEEVRRTEPKLTGFKIEHSAVESIPLGETKKIVIVPGQTVEVTVNKPKDENGRITLTIQPPKLTAITYECVCDKYIALATQHYVEKMVGKEKDQQQLFIAVMAKPCTLKK